ncbi:SMI1/KNR4 family protein [Spirillospora sp. NPDC052269]
MSADMAWERILGWLDGHAPATIEYLGIPADPSDIKSVQEALSVVLPADLVAWWERSNGAALKPSGHPFQLLPGYSLYTAEEALRGRGVWLQVWRDDAIALGQYSSEDYARVGARPAGAHAGMWLPSWLPIAGSGGGTDLFVDLRPGPRHGCVREFDKASADGDVRWDGITAMLLDVAESLETGRPLDGERPHVTDGLLHWERGVRYDDE